MPTDAVVLIGPMGAGKTSIGRRVAKGLRLPFTDTDISVKNEHGPIEKIFAEQGEDAFRAFERSAVVAALARGGIVSVGGGAVLHPATRADLAARRVVLLTVEPKVVAGRVRESKRPLLKDGDPMQRWTEIYRERRPIYEEIADVVFDTSNGAIADVVTAVTEWVRETEGQR